MRFAVPFSTISFAAFALLLSCKQAIAADSLESLLEKSRAASGAPYRYHVVSRSHENRNGHSYNVTTETEGLKYRARECVRALCTSGFYFDGERSFDTNFNDTALPLSARVDALQLTLRAIASYAFTSPTFRSDGGQIEDRETILRDGKKFRRIAVAPRLGALLEAVIDPDTGLVAGVISEERRLAFEFRDQRKVGNRITLPYAIELNGVEIERFDDRSIDPAPLAAPPGIVPQLPAGGASVTMSRSDAPLVPCSIGGQNVSCLFDTGNSGLSLSTELAAKLGLSVQTGGVLPASSALAGVAKAPALAVGGATFPSAQYVVIGGIHALGYDVVLGADAFAHARVTFDFAKRTVSIAPAGPAVANGLALDFENFVPAIDVELGGVPVQLPIDSGDASAVDLAADYATGHPAAAGASVTARVGGSEIARVRVDTAKRPNAPNPGVIGSALLQHFVTTFDYAHARVGLAPRAGDPDVRPVHP
ncbi:MAG: aspartyl protease family protein [Candidatus Eremiobacteraeota bacterium]|nr:aspartyl protease family protein [Candidatus Eremiobacteraeota bacterium]